MVNPVVSALKFVNAELSGLKLAHCEIRKNHRYVAAAWVHRVRAVTAALPVATGMNMDIRDEAHAELLAFVMHQVKQAPVKLNDSVVEAMRVDVVVIEKLADNAGIVFDISEQERATFASPVRSPPQFRNAVAPHPFVALNLGWRATEPVMNRRD